MCSAGYSIVEIYPGDRFGSSTFHEAPSARSRRKTEAPEDSRSLPPPRRGIRHPWFDTLDEDDLELLCDELADHEPGIVRGDLKRGRGVAPYGVEGDEAQVRPMTA